MVLSECVDFTELKKAVERKRVQLPVAGELFGKMHGAKYFTTLDAASGFWQIPLAPQCSAEADDVYHSVWSLSF